MAEPAGREEKAWFQSKWPFGNVSTAEKPSFFRKITPVLALFPTTVLSSVLLYGMGRPPFIDHDFYNFVADHRITLQAVLNLLTTIFGVWHLFVLKSVINFRSRSRLQPSDNPPSLIHLRLWKALAAYKVDWSLPLRFQFSMHWVQLLALLPSSLWTGALTPNLVTHNVTVPLLLPKYVPDPDGAYWNATWTPTGKPTRKSSLPLDTNAVI